MRNRQTLFTTTRKMVQNGRALLERKLSRSMEIGEARGTQAECGWLWPERGSSLERYLEIPTYIRRGVSLQVGK